LNKLFYEIKRKYENKGLKHTASTIKENNNAFTLKWGWFFVRGFLSDFYGA